MVLLRCNGSPGCVIATVSLSALLDVHFNNTLGFRSGQFSGQANSVITRLLNLYRERQSPATKLNQHFFKHTNKGKHAVFMSSWENTGGSIPADIKCFLKNRWLGFSTPSSLDSGALI